MRNHILIIQPNIIAIEVEILFPIIYFEQFGFFGVTNALNIYSHTPDH